MVTEEIGNFLDMPSLDELDSPPKAAEGSEGTPWPDREADEPEPEPEPEPQQQPVAAQPQQPQPDIANEFFRGLNAWEQEKRAREVDEARRNAMARSWQPPALPEDPDTLLVDGKALATAIEQSRAWAGNLAIQGVSAIDARTQALEREMAEVRQTRADLAWDRARVLLVNEGVENPDQFIGDVEVVCRQNPQTYWQLKTSPQALALAAKHIRDYKAQQSGASPVRDRTPSPPSAGVNSGGRSQAAANAVEADSVIRQVEKAFGRRMSDRSRRAYYEKTRASR